MTHRQNAPTLVSVVHLTANTTGKAHSRQLPSFHRVARHRRNAVESMSIRTKTGARSSGSAANDEISNRGASAADLHGPTHPSCLCGCFASASNSRQQADSNVRQMEACLWRVRAISVRDFAPQAGLRPVQVPSLVVEVREQAHALTDAGQVSKASWHVATRLRWPAGTRTNTNLNSRHARHPTRVTGSFNVT